MQILIRLEYLFLALAIMAIYVTLGFSWYWLILLFLLFDLSAIGYLINKRIGAILYNAVHSVIAPSILLIIYIISEEKTLLFVDLLWFFHITVDRTFGYGLKHFEGFKSTHLGKIG